MTCSKCKKSGHNRATCTEEDITVIEHVQHAVTVPKKGNETIELPEGVRTKFMKLAALCAEVAHTLGRGYTEMVYQHALCIELQSNGIKHRYEVPMPIMYKGSATPYCNNRLDIVIDDYLPFIFEIKATTGHIKSSERWQLVRYMEQQGKPYGAVVNFTQRPNSKLNMSFIVYHEGSYKIYDVMSGKIRTVVDHKYVLSSVYDEDDDSASSNE